MNSIFTPEKVTALFFHSVTVVTAYQSSLAKVSFEADNRHQHRQKHRQQLLQFVLNNSPDNKEIILFQRTRKERINNNLFFNEIFD